jgi:hypothetical protein
MEDREPKDSQSVAITPLAQSLIAARDAQVETSLALADLRFELDIAKRNMRAEQEAELIRKMTALD